MNLKFSYRSVKNFTLQLLILTVMFLYISSASANTTLQQITELQELSNSSIISTEETTSLSNSDTAEVEGTEYEYSVNGTYGYQRHPSKIAAVVVYCIAAFIGIFGVLIKYFVMQYERLQAKAQLEYQQLQMVKTY